MEKRYSEETAEVIITPYRDGPYLVRGPFALRDPEGAPIPVARRTIALCRCGKSRTRPYCDGTHKLIDFRAPGVLEVWPPAGAGR
jgi:CDGSH-type Zn-finger protein